MVLEKYSEKESEDLNNTTKHHQLSALPISPILRN